jgi:thiamine biosynthesis lipoprotein
MGTTYSVQVTRQPAGVNREQVQRAIDDVLEETNRLFSTYDPGSEISRFNASDGTSAVEVSPEFARLLTIAEGVSVATGGAFDITVGPLVRAWGFGAGADDAGTTPDPATLAAAREAVGLDKLRLTENGLALQKSFAALQLDVDAVAPGWAVDEISQRLDALGVTDYLVELGGEVRARGESPTSRAWRIAVEAPRGGERRPYTLVELDGLAASTSGDYRDFRIVDGRRVSHTIDPRTGAPVTHSLASVCVLHPSAAYADAYATALMVLGPEEGMAVATQLGLAALFIERTADRPGFTERSTAGFERLRRALD